jgi:alkylation response protein AidB-like acyl-CoA dehydrogenase
MTTHLISRRDVDFLLEEWLDAPALLGRERFAEHDRHTFAAVLDLAEQLAGEVLAPINALLDTHEPRMLADGTVEQPAELASALATLAESGLGAATFDAEVGGSQLPFVVRAAASAYLQAGSIAAYAYPFLSEGNAHLLVAHGTPEQVRLYARPIVEGRWFGTMALSEPQAGSSLGDITTTATAQDDGSWRLSGSKMWISGGDHELSENIVHLVLARTAGAPAGTRGLSLFVVPKWLVHEDGTLGERNGVTLVGLNHKMGYRGTTNTLLELDGAVGHLVGEVGHGLAAMFHMMNEARIGVGSGAVALGYRGYLESLHYARTRTQGRPLTDRDPSAAPVPIIDHADVRRMLLAQKSYVEGGLALTLFCARLVDDAATAPSDPEREEAARLLDLLTPIAKSWPSQWCLKANDLAIQVLGGYGYTRDFPLEQLYRDNRLNPIHEGTHGIQAIDLLGRKVTNPGGGFGPFGARLLATVARAGEAGGAAAAHAEALAASWARLEEVTASLHALPDRGQALANASLYLEAFGHLVVAWLWLEQELAAAERQGAFYDGKRAAAAYFFGYELPTVAPLLDVLAGADRALLELDPDVL